MTALEESPAHRLGVRRNAVVSEYDRYRNLITFLSKFLFLLFFLISSEPRDTLQEGYQVLEQGEVKGLLLDAYVAGSQIKDLSRQLRVKEVIKLSKGIGVVLAGEAIKLQSRVHDYITDNAETITKIIENSTTPLEVYHLAIY